MIMMMVIIIVIIYETNNNIKDFFFFKTMIIIFDKFMKHSYIMNMKTDLLTVLLYRHTIHTKIFKSSRKQARLQRNFEQNYILFYMSTILQCPP